MTDVSGRLIGPIFNEEIGCPERSVTNQKSTLVKLEKRIYLILEVCVSNTDKFSMILMVFSVPLKQFRYSIWKWR